MRYKSSYRREQREGGGGRRGMEMEGAGLGGGGGGRVMVSKEDWSQLRRGKRGRGVGGLLKVLGLGKQTDKLSRCGNRKRLLGHNDQTHHRVDPRQWVTVMISGSVTCSMEGHGVTITSIQGETTD